MRRCALLIGTLAAAAAAPSTPASGSAASALGPLRRPAFAPPAHARRAPTARMRMQPPRGPNGEKTPYVDAEDAKRMFHDMPPGYTPVMEYPGTCKPGITPENAPMDLLNTEFETGGLHGTGEFPHRAPHLHEAPYHFRLPPNHPPNHNILERLIIEDRLLSDDDADAVDEKPAKRKPAAVGEPPKRRGRKPAAEVVEAVAEPDADEEDIEAGGGADDLLGSLGLGDDDDDDEGGAGDDMSPVAALDAEPEAADLAE